MSLGDVTVLLLLDRWTTMISLSKTQSLFLKAIITATTTHLSRSRWNGFLLSI